MVEIIKEKGEQVKERETLALIEKTEGVFRFFCFLPFQRGQSVKEGMEVTLREYSSQKTYHGKVAFVSPFVISQDRLVDLLGNENLVRFFTKDTPVIEIQIEMEKGTVIPPRTLANVVIILSSNRIISYLIPSLRDPS